MDTKIETKIKEEDPVSDNAALQDKTEFTTKDVIIKTNSDTVPMADDCDVAINTEIKLEPPFPDFCLQIDREYYTNHFKQVKSETVSCSNNCQMDTKTEIGSQKKREFLPECSALKVKKYNSDNEIENKIEIKEEPWWLETKTSSVNDDVKDVDFTPVKSPRLCTEAVSDDSSGGSPIPSAEASEKNTMFNCGQDYPKYESQESEIVNIPAVEGHVHPELSGKYSGGEEIYSRGVLPNKIARSHKCNICDKSFTQLSALRLHNLIHEGKKPHKCQLCEKSFTALISLKRHKLIHESKNPHKCETCEKSFTQLSSLKLHNLIHEGKKPHKCETCKKSFTQLAHLKRHNLIHESKVPHRCEICGKRFPRVSLLKSHNLLHEGKKLHKCKICGKMFTQLSNLKKHNLIHEGKKPHLCEICGKRFTRLSHLKSHNLVHVGKKPHKVEIVKNDLLGSHI